MKAMIGATFMLATLGMVVVYPMYFYALNEFKKKFIEMNKDAWEKFSNQRRGIGVQNAYQALEASRQGQIEGIRLCNEVMAARKRAVKLLYVGMSLFMIVLIIGLVESIST
jgi:hypothetical protein